MCEISVKMQDLIVARASHSELTAAAIEAGLITLRDYGLQKVRYGETSMEEILSISANDPAVESSQPVHQPDASVYL